MTLTPEVIREIRKLRSEGYTQKEVAEEIGVSPPTVRKYEKKEAVEVKPQTKAEKEVPWAKTFEIYSNGGDPTEAVMELDIDPDTAKQTFEKFAELKDIDIKSIGEINEEIEQMREKLVEHTSGWVDDRAHLNKLTGNNIKWSLLSLAEYMTRNVVCDKCEELSLPHLEDEWRCGKCDEKIWFK